MSAPDRALHFGPPPPAQACRQCGRCASVCPRSRPPELSPRRVVRLVQLGLRDEAARHPFLHSCRFCGKCLVKCPHGVEVARLVKRLVFEQFLGPPG